MFTQNKKCSWINAKMRLLDMNHVRIWIAHQMEFILILLFPSYSSSYFSCCYVGSWKVFYSFLYLFFMIAKCRTQCECVDELVFSFDFSTSEGISGVLFAKEREREKES